MKRAQASGRSVSHSGRQVVLLACVAALGLAAAGASARAEGVRLSKPGDAAGDAVRAVASDYYSKLAGGDLAGARALFAGSPDQGQFIDASLASTVALDRLTTALAGKFGQSETLKAWQEGGAAYKRRQAEEAKAKLVVISGDEAVVAGSALADLGMRLHHDGASWKIIGLTPVSESAAPYVALNNRLAGAADSLRTRVEAGGFYRLEPGLTEMSRLNEEAMGEWSKAMEAAATDSSGAVALAAASVGHSLSGAALAALPGKGMDSPEVAALLASLGGVPDVTDNDDGTALSFRASGIAFGFDPKDGTLTALTFHDGGDAGYGKYAGELPMGLSFGARRAEAEKLLGAPAWSLGTTEYAADFPSKGVTLNFAGKGPRDPDAAVRRIDLVAARADAAPATKGFALRLVADATDADAEAVPLLAADAQGVQEMRLKKTVLADGGGLVTVIPNFNPEAQSWGVELAFSDAAGKALTAATQTAAGKTIAVVAGGKIVTAVRLQSALGERVVLTLGAQATPESARGLAGQIHAAAFTLP